MSWWDNLSVRWKFMSGITVILLATVASSALFMMTLEKLDIATERFAVGSHLNESFLEREIQHLQWVNSLSSYIGGDADELRVTKEPTQCSFGKWFYSDERRAAERVFPEIVDELRRIDEPHKELHATAVSIEQLKKSGDQEAAERYFHEKTLPALATVQKQFRDITAQITADMTTFRNEFSREISSAYLWTICLGSLASIAVLLLGVVLFKSILRPIQQITRFSVDSLKGDAAPLALERTDELGVLAGNLTALMDHLGEQLAYSRGILEGLTVPCSVFSPQDTTVFTNRHMLNLIERDGTPEDYVGMTSGEYIWGDKTAETLSTKALRENRALSAEREFTTRKGNKKHALISSAPFYNQGGKTLGTLSVWIDLTEVMEKQRLIEESGKRIAEVAASARDVASNVSASSAEISVQVEQSSRGAIAQRDKIGETAAAMMRVNESALEVANSAVQTSQATAEAHAKARDGSQSVGRVVESIQQVVSHAHEMKNGMDRLGEQVQGVGHIIGIINEIADQTNLLALNAAIEAARAGESGRGFAVVADEVRKLAEKTMEATKEVETAISGIRSGTTETLHSMEHAAQALETVSGMAAEAGDNLDAIVGLVKGVSLQVDSIASASEEQSQASKSVNQALEEVSGVSEETSVAMNEAARAVDSLADQANTLRALIEKLR